MELVTVPKNVNPKVEAVVDHVVVDTESAVLVRNSHENDELIHSFTLICLFQFLKLFFCLISKLIQLDTTTILTMHWKFYDCSKWIFHCHFHLVVSYYYLKLLLKWWNFSYTVMWWDFFWKLYIFPIKRTRSWTVSYNTLSMQW